MSTLVPSVLPTDPARGGGEHTQLYHTPDGNGRASAPEGVDVAAGSAGSIPLAKSDAKVKKSNWFGGAMDTVVKVFQGDKDSTLTRAVGGNTSEDEPRDVGGPSDFSATATANANNTEAADASDYEEFAEQEGVEGGMAPPSMLVAKLIEEQAGVVAQRQLETFLRQTVTPQLTTLQNELKEQLERNKADQLAFSAVVNDLRAQLEEEKSKASTAKSRCLDGTEVR
ncbi:hypothetical protein AB1Y20_000668 [Prymnesium parvum]|uniref:Uncharacterized protein n=1 Tax=Prymnesium parvum TaxID=97485 RepID=A0AB34K8M9_PRYPA